MSIKDEADGAILQAKLPLGTAMDRQIFLCRTVNEQAIYKMQSEPKLIGAASYFASCLLMPTSR